MGSSPIIRIFLWNNLIPILNHVIGPPQKIWFSANLYHKSIPLKLNWLSLFQVLQCLPHGDTVLSHQNNLPPFYCLFSSSVTRPIQNIIFIFCHFHPGSVIIEKLLKQKIVVSIIIHSCKRNYFNFFGMYGGFVAILVLYFRNCSSPRCALCSNSLVCIENHLFIVGIVPIINKELEFIFRSDCSDRTYIYS